MNHINQIFSSLINRFKKIYLNSSLYDKKISKVYNNNFEYKPSPYLLSSLIKYQKKKCKIEDFALESVWENNINSKDYKKLNNFFWFFSLDLRSSKKVVQSVIDNWIKNNHKYNHKSWDFDLTSKRIIAWLSNYQLTYEDSDKEYRDKFNWVIQKQANYLVNEIDKSSLAEDKMIGCAAIILVGISYQDKKNYLDSGLDLLKNIIKSSLDKESFPKSRNIRQLKFYLKYFILIREWLKESQSEIPDFINENIYYLGQAYAFSWQNNKVDLLFNGNHKDNNIDFDYYLKRLGYNFKNQTKELGGYVILSNKKTSLIMDVGASPDKKFSSNYQAGALSFEILSNGKKLICNSGYFQNYKHQLNELSKSSAIHSTLTLDDRSSCKFSKNKNKSSKVLHGIKIIKKNIIFEKNYWKVNASHDGYLKQYGVLHDREIEFYPEQIKFIGHDKIISKNNIKNLKFEIRFHLEPNIKIMKTQDNKSILIDLDGEGWKFNSDNNTINIDNGLYFGKKNFFVDNHNIVISGMTNDENQTIKWEIIKL